MRGGGSARLGERLGWVCAAMYALWRKGTLDVVWWRWMGAFVGCGNVVFGRMEKAVPHASNNV